MSRAYRVILRGRGHEADSHRMWICFEDIWSTLRDKDLGFLSLDEVDAARDQITVTRVKAKKLNRSKTLVRKVLKRHYFAEEYHEIIDEEVAE